METINFINLSETESVYTRKDDEIIECHVIAVIFKTEEYGEFEPYQYEVKCNEGIVRLPISQEFYSMEDEWSSKTNIKRIWNLSSKELLRKLLEYPEESCYYFDGVDAVKFHWEDWISCIRLSGEYCNKVEVIEGKELPKIYPSEEAVYAYNDIKITKEDGSVVVKKCAAHKVRLTKEQQKCVDEFEKACAKLNESGVYLVGDENHLMYINDKDVCSYDCCCGDLELLPSEFQRSSLKVIACCDDIFVDFK